MLGRPKLYAILTCGVVVWLSFVTTVVAWADVKLPSLELKDTRLSNGLRVILVPDHSAPVYAINVTYNVGSRNERPGRTGFAHSVRAHDVRGLAERRQGRAFHPGAE